MWSRGREVYEGTELTFKRSQIQIHPEDIGSEVSSHTQIATAWSGLRRITKEGLFNGICSDLKVN